MERICGQGAARTKGTYPLGQVSALVGALAQVEQLVCTGGEAAVAATSGATVAARCCSCCVCR